MKIAKSILFLVFFLNTNVIICCNKLSIDTTKSEDLDLLACSSSGDLPGVINCIKNRNANINVRDSNGYTPLRWACCKGNRRIVDFLVKNGANLNHVDLLSTETDLHNASSKGFFNIVKILIDAKANVNARDAWGNTPLIHACSTNKLNVVKLLIRSSANLDIGDYENYSVLHEACRRNNIAMITTLIKAGANTTQKNIHSRGAFDFLSRKAQLQIAKLIVPLKKNSILQSSSILIIKNMLKIVLQQDQITDQFIHYTVIIPHIEAAINYFKGEKTDKRIIRTALTSFLELENPDIFLTTSARYFYTNLDLCWAKIKKDFTKPQKNRSKFNDLNICFR